MSNIFPVIHRYHPVDTWPSFGTTAPFTTRFSPLYGGAPPQPCRPRALGDNHTVGSPHRRSTHCQRQQAKMTALEQTLIAHMTQDLKPASHGNRVYLNQIPRIYRMNMDESPGDILLFAFCPEPVRSTNQIEATREPDPGSTEMWIAQLHLMTLARHWLRACRSLSQHWYAAGRAPWEWNQQMGSDGFFRMS